MQSDDVKVSVVDVSYGAALNSGQRQIKGKIKE